MKHGLHLWLLLACALSASACAEKREHEPLLPGGGQWVSDVRSTHAKVDAALAEDRLDEARALLRGALDEQVPQAVEAEHRRVVQQDLWFRLAMLELDADAPEAALAAADAGLQLGQADDLFSANLLIGKGRALEQLDRGKQAASSYYAALEINEKLLAKALGKDDP